MLNKKTLWLGIIFFISTIGLSGSDIIKTELNNKKKHSTFDVHSEIEEKQEINKENKEYEEKKRLKEILQGDSNNITKLVNKEHGLAKGYKPTDMIVPDVKLYCPKGSERSYMREEAAKALEELFQEAKGLGFELYLVSAFRSSNYQDDIFNYSFNNKGKEHTEKYIAAPNHSEHQTGLVADISTLEMDFELEQSFKDTKEGEWLKENAHRHGFILRYKEEREEDTGFTFEPWHFRYVGKELSTYIYENELVLEDIYNKLKN